MSKIRLRQIKIKNYRSFGEEQLFVFPNEDYTKPVAIVGYNNCGKTNLMNAILYALNINFVSRDTFQLNDFHNRRIENVPEIELSVGSSKEAKVNDKPADLTGYHKLWIKINENEIVGSAIKSYEDNGIRENYQAFGAIKCYNVFFINFHKIKDEISTKRTSWGNLSSFLARHLQKIIAGDMTMHGKKETYKSETAIATDKVLEGSDLIEFIDVIKKNYKQNLRHNNCHVDFGLPDYEEIFLQMLFKIGLHGSTENLIPIDHFGDGYISMFVMAVIQAIAESNVDDKCLFLFEEPESFLHVNHQEYFYKTVLCTLAENGHQVIYTTHSDKMVDVFERKGIIRLEFDEVKNQTVKKYNDDNIPFDQEQLLENLPLKYYNAFVKSVEPNLNKILFSKKVLLVEGPNDVMAYKFAIEKKLMTNGRSKREAETYLSFLNIAVVPHHGKLTALLLIDLCKYFALDYFVITDLDLDDDCVDKIDAFSSLEALHNSPLYTEESRVDKMKLTGNWRILKKAGKDKIHFNKPRLESVLQHSDLSKDSLSLWNRLLSIDVFPVSFLSPTLEEFLELGTKSHQPSPVAVVHLDDDLPF